VSEDVEKIPDTARQTTERFERFDAAIDARPKPRRKRSGWTRGRQILAEVGRLIEHRYGGPCDTDDGAIWVRAALPSIAEASGGLEEAGFARQLEDWARVAVPQVSAAELTEGIAEARSRNERGRLFWTADQLGDLLALTIAEREHLKIRTIRPGSMTADEFEQYRRRRKTTGRQALRQAAAAASPEVAMTTPATVSAESAKPWEAEGISRRTWYRRRKDGTGTADVANRSEGSPIATRPVSQAPKHPVASPRADSSTRRPLRSSAGTGKPANDNRRMKLWQPKRGRRMAVVGTVNDNGGDC